MDSQAELFPFAHPATVLQYIRRLEIMVLKYAPELTRQHCWDLLCDLSIAVTTMEHATRQPVPPIKPWTISVETLLRCIRDLDRSVTETISADDCLRLLADLTDTTAILQGIGRAIERDKRWQHRQTLPPTSERDTDRAYERIAFSHFDRIARRGRRGSKWSS
ncbi:MAG TPA: hypothetical protein VI670_27805 [Thermoanaerobaculia bacterium]|jgi:hypothetical protein